MPLRGCPTGPTDTFFLHRPSCIFFWHSSAGGGAKNVIWEITRRRNTWGLNCEIGQKLWINPNLLSYKNKCMLYYYVYLKHTVSWVLELNQQNRPFLGCFFFAILGLFLCLFFVFAHIWLILSYFSIILAKVDLLKSTHMMVLIHNIPFLIKPFPNAS